MSETREKIEDLEQLRESGDGIGRQVEPLPKIRDWLAAREIAVKKIAAFKIEFERACGLFAEASTALQVTGDYPSEVDKKIAESIDEHLRAVGALCRYGTAIGSAGEGFGCNHHFIED